MLAWLERNQLLIVAVAAVLLLGGLLARDLGESPPPALMLRDDPVDASAPLVVHVAGAVDSPGVFELPGGARVQDAIAAAGGAASHADLDALNLARHLHDGEKILVPGAPLRAPAALVVEGEALDLNTATRAQLMALPGIGEAYSRRIVDSRSADGPFASVEELLERRLIPAATLEHIRPLVTVATP